MKSGSMSQQKTFGYEQWIERHFGLIISICLHFILLIVWLNTMVPETRDGITKRVRITLQTHEEIFDPLVEEPPPEPNLPHPLEQFATLAGSEVETEQVSEDVQSLDQPVEVTMSVATVERLDGQKEELLGELKDLDLRKRKLKMQLLSEVRVMTEANIYDYAAEGSQTGVLRSLDLTGFSKGVVDSVMTRYNIRIDKRYIKDERPTYSFINSARKGDQVYRNVVGSGQMYEVFMLSNSALARMVSLEHEEMERRGFDRNKTKINKVVFGIVSVGDRYDLGIKQFEAFQIIE